MCKCGDEKMGVDNGKIAVLLNYELQSINYYLIAKSRFRSGFRGNEKVPANRDLLFLLRRIIV